jgi:uncharacterized protein with HEPN domain
MPRDFLLYVDDTLDAISRIREYAADMEPDDLFADRKTTGAIAHNLEIIGEAARALPDSAKQQTPEIYWRKIVGLRKLLIRAYLEVSLSILWDIVRNKLDPLESACGRLLSR